MKRFMVLIFYCFFINAVPCQAEVYYFGSLAIELPEQYRPYYTIAMPGPDRPVGLYEFSIAKPPMKPYWPEDLYKGPEDLDKWLAWFLDNKYKNSDKLNDPDKGCSLYNYNDVSGNLGRPAWLYRYFQCIQPKNTDEKKYKSLQFELIVKTDGGYVSFHTQFEDDDKFIQKMKEVGFFLDSSFTSQLKLPVGSATEAEVYDRERQAWFLTYVKDEILPNYEWVGEDNSLSASFATEFGRVKTALANRGLIAGLRLLSDKIRLPSIEFIPNKPEFEEHWRSAGKEINQRLKKYEGRPVKHEERPPLFFLWPRALGDRPGLELRAYRQFTIEYPYHRQMFTICDLMWFELISPENPFRLHMEVKIHFNPILLSSGPIAEAAFAFEQEKFGITYENGMHPGLKSWEMIFNGVKPLNHNP